MWFILSYSNGALFKTIFHLKMFSCVLWNTIIMKTIRSWKKLSLEYMCRLISTVNIVHKLLLFPHISVHSPIYTGLTAFPLYVALFLDPSILCASELAFSFHLKKKFAYPDPKITVEKLLMWDWYWNKRSWSIQIVCWMDEYCWWSGFDEHLHYGSTCVTTSLIHCGGQ